CRAMSIIPSRAGPLESKQFSNVVPCSENVRPDLENCPLRISAKPLHFRPRSRRAVSFASVLVTPSPVWSKYLIVRGQEVVLMRHRVFKTFCVLLGGAFLLTVATFAQDSKPGKLKIKVSPKQAYTFIDGKAIGPGNRTIKLDVGTHHLVVANYGFKFVEQDTSIDPDHTLPLDIRLEPAGAEVPGPRGRIQIEVGMRRAGDAAVLLNGNKPQYFVGHVDEFNNDIIKHQELIVPPGRHELTVTRYGKELWTGLVSVGANQRVIVNISNGKQDTKDWPRGSNELGGGVQRFKAGTASATIAIAPVSGTVSANPPNINCSQNTQLAWTSSETVEADMSGMSPVPTSGER